MAKDLRAWVDSDLVFKVKAKYPALEGMTTTGLVDYLLRKALEADA